MGASDEFWANRDDLWSNVLDAAEDIEHYALQMSQHYDDAREMRRSLQAYVQAARNVTFRIQAGKSTVENLAEWYQPWQSLMAADPLMTWMKNARNTVTKQRALLANSRIVVSLYQSYDEPPTARFEFPPDAPMADVAASFCTQFRQQSHAQAMVALQRRWEIDDLPEQDVLDAAGAAAAVYRAMTNDFGRFLESGEPGRIPPVDLVASADQLDLTPPGGACRLLRSGDRQARRRTCCPSIHSDRS